jgi:hypothetical protein
MKNFPALLLIAIFAVSINAQTVLKNADSTKVIMDSVSLELAKATLKVHGGEKFKNAKTIILRGTVEVSAPNSAQTLPATFNLVFAGERYRFDIQAPPIINFQQLFDGDRTYSSMPGISLPPMNRLGLPMLTKLDADGFVVSTLPEKLKKKRGFRITSPEGYYTDFILDEKTSQVKEYESSYEINGRTVTTSVAVNKYRDVDGVLLSDRFSQRLDMGQFTTYADFKAKDILVNSEVGDDVFVLKN